MNKSPQDMSEIVGTVLGNLVKKWKLMRLSKVFDEHIKIINCTEFHCCTVMKEEMGHHNLFSTVLEFAGCHRATCL